jgi:hypothetical protein
MYNVNKIPSKQIILDTDSNLSANSDTIIPSQKAIKTYVNNSINVFKKVYTLYGDDNTSTFTIQHNIGTMDVIVQVYSYTSSTSGGLHENMNVEIQRSDNNNITIQFAVAPPNSESFRVLVM